MKKFWKFILTIIIAVAAYGYEAYDFGSEAHEAISLLQGQLEVKLLDVGHGTNLISSARLIKNYRNRRLIWTEG